MEQSSSDEEMAVMIREFSRLCEAAEMVGGIHLSQIVEGRNKIPKGWRFDPITLYYVPPLVIFSGKIH